MRFSERIGINPAKIIQINSMDADLRNGLWSALTLNYWETYQHSVETLIPMLWLHFFKEPIDTINESWGYCLDEIRKLFFEFEWWKVYDFIEFIAETGGLYRSIEFIKMYSGLACQDQF